MEIAEDQYIEQRLENQIDWYSSRATVNKRWHYALKTIELTSSVLIPFLVGYAKHDWCQFTIGMLGVIVALSSGIQSSFGFHRKWIDFRATSEMLKHEKFWFGLRKGDYCGPDALDVLVRRVESLISKENTDWSQYAHTRHCPEEGKTLDGTVATIIKHDE